MEKRVYACAAALFFASLLAGCKKDPGEGGSSTIRGVLYAKNVHDRNSPMTADDFEPNQKVYISYGDKSTYDDDYETGPDGTFEFKYLRKGKYRISAYSRDTATMGLVSVSRLIEVDNSEVKSVNDLMVYKEANDDGNNSIRGKVMIKEYDHTFTDFRGQYYAGDEDVYISFGDNGYYNDRIRSSFDGSFQFNNLRKGKYKVFVFSKDSTRKQANDIPVIREVTVSGKNELISVGDMVKFD
jgi:hypothetical protein